MVASTVANTITIALPEAEFGTPTSGWTFTVAITGQDGYSADQAISFTPTPGAYTLGVCPAGGTAPICSLPTGSVPEVMDTITPPGVSPGHRAQPGPRAGRPAGGHRPVAQERDNSKKRGAHHGARKRARPERSGALARARQRCHADRHRLVCPPGRSQWGRQREGQ